MLRHRFPTTLNWITEIDDRVQPFLDFLDQPHSFCVFLIIPFAMDNTSAVIFWHWNSVLLIKVKNIYENDATDLKILHDDIIPGTVFFNSTIQVLV